MTTVLPAASASRSRPLQDGDGAVVERGERLVEQQHRRLVQERAGHRQALAHAARELAHQAVADAIEAGAFQPFERRPPRVGQAVERREELQVFERRKLVVDRDAVADEADPARVAVSRGPCRRSGPGRGAGREKPADDAQQRGLSRAVAADQRQARARRRLRSRCRAGQGNRRNTSRPPSTASAFMPYGRCPLRFRYMAANPQARMASDSASTL